MVTKNVVTKNSDTVWTLEPAKHDLFHNIQSCKHCLYPLLPLDRLRNRGHDLQTPNTCNYNLHKRSFSVNCPFKSLITLFLAERYFGLCLIKCYISFVICEIKITHSLTHFARVCAGKLQAISWHKGGAHIVSSIIIKADSLVSWPWHEGVTSNSHLVTLKKR